MALAIRAIPTLTGINAERFIADAEASERNPHTAKLRVSRDEVRRMMKKSRNFKF